MKKQPIVLAILGALTVSSSAVFAATVDVPNTFTAGTPAVAAEVNANFTAVEAAVNTSDSEIAANTAAIEALNTGVTSGCPTNAGEMVKVGSFCVDKYEATIYGAEDGSGGPILTSSLDPMDDGSGCTETGNECSVGAAEPIFARSDAGVTPTANITWFQAAQACANVGKRLITNAEWQTAAAGTPDNATDCNTNTGVATANNASSTCVSNWGTINMVGNLWEYTADWVQGAGAIGNAANGPAFGDDAAVEVGAATSQANPDDRFMGTIARGGAFGTGLMGDTGAAAGVFAINNQNAPSNVFNNFGFRCAL